MQRSKNHETLLDARLRSVFIYRLYGQELLFDFVVSDLRLQRSPWSSCPCFYLGCCKQREQARDGSENLKPRAGVSTALAATLLMGKRELVRNEELRKKTKA